MKSGRIIVGTLTGLVFGFGILLEIIVLNQLVFYSIENEIAKRVLSVFALVFASISLKQHIQDDISYMKYRRRLSSVVIGHKISTFLRRAS